MATAITIIEWFVLISLGVVVVVVGVNGIVDEVRLRRKLARAREAAWDDNAVRRVREHDYVG
jgi:hypothetical protein